jgi:hypothetical protein
VNNLFQLGTDWPAFDFFQHEKQNSAAVQRRVRNEVDKSQVKGDEAGKF